MKKQSRKTLSRLLVVLLVLSCVCTSALAETTVTLKKHLSYNLGRTTISWDVTGMSRTPTMFPSRSSTTAVRSKPAGTWAIPLPIRSRPPSAFRARAMKSP